MNRLSLALAILALAMVSCVIPLATPLPTLNPPTATALATATKLPTQEPTIANAWTAKVQLPTVNVRQSPDGKVIGSVSVGNTVTILSCVGNWCKIEKPAGYIFRGCLSDNPKKLRCEAK